MSCDVGVAWRGMSTHNDKKTGGKLPILVTSCEGTAFENTLLKKDSSEGKSRKKI